MKAITILIIIQFLTSILCIAQSEKKYIRDGNTNYKKEKYDEAAQQYLNSLDKNANTYTGAFNLGDALYKQGKYEEAANQFLALSEKAATEEDKANAYHNLGNAYLQSKKIQESVNAYKNALRNNPNDEDTRYNLAYAQKLLQQQQQNQNKDDNNKQDKQDQNKQDNKDKQDQQQKQEQQQQQEQQNKEQQQNQKEQQAKEEQLSKEDAKRLLEALNNEEKNVQEKLKLQKEKKGVRVKIEKDW